MDKPKIGILLDHQASGSFSKRAHYALREHYFAAVESCHAIPFGIPYVDRHSFTHYVQQMDGFISPGGNFASPNDWYVAEKGHFPYQPSKRLAYDKAFIHAVLQSNKPLLAICAGMQMLCGIHCCQLTRNLHQYYQVKRNYLDGTPPESFAYDVKVVENSFLHKITKQRTISVNSAHQEAVVKLSKEVSANAYSPEGVLEAISLDHYRFVLGVQWHPEYFASIKGAHKSIFEAFIQAASEKNDASQ